MITTIEHHTDDEQFYFVYNRKYIIGLDEFYCERRRNDYTILRKIQIIIPNDSTRQLIYTDRKLILEICIYKLFILRVVFQTLTKETDEFSTKSKKFTYTQFAVTTAYFVIQLLFWRNRGINRRKTLSKTGQTCWEMGSYARK